jgi:SAM domain (Sterile alpha motif)
MNAEDLKELGISSFGHRRKLLHAISALRGAPATRDVAQSALSVTSAPVSSPTIDAERRQLTVMFCDLVGSTPLSWRHALPQYPELLFEAPASPPLRTRENLAVNLTSPRMSTPEVLLIDQPRIIHCTAARKRAAASSSIRRAQDDPQLTLTALR